MKQHNRKHAHNVPAGGGLQNMSPKTMAAVVLMTVMGLLLGRVLRKGDGGPASANAATTQQNAEAMAADAAVQSEPAFVRIERVQLPVLSGRNDMITKNPFSTDHWKAFAFHEVPEPEEKEVAVVKPVVVENTEAKRHQANMKKIAGRLTLEGVIRDVNDVPFQAFVDGKILSVGSVLTVKEGPDKYELALISIEEQEILMIWNDLTVKLKLTETVEN